MMDMTHQRRAKIVSALITHFNVEKMNYCILGNLIDFPENITSDVDICLSPACFVNFHNTLQQFCTENNLAIIQKLKHEISAISYVIAALDQSCVEVMLDVYSDYMIKGRVILTAAEILHDKHVILKNSLSIAIPSDHVSFIYYSIKHIYKQSLEQRGADYLSSLTVDSSSLEACLSAYIGVNNSGDFLKLISADRLTELNASLPAFASSLYKTVAYPLSARFREFLRILSRIVYPTGLFITFLGPDGSGKSTVINKLIDDDWYAFRRFDTFHLRPSLWHNRSAAIAVTDPHGKKPRGFLMTFIKSLYFVFDYTIGFIIKIYPKLIRSSLVIFDRYYYDIEVDPNRYRISNGMFLFKWLANLIPKPDVIIILAADADTIQSRKKEVPYDECCRQVEDYARLAKLLPNAFLINASESVDYVVKEVRHIIIDSLCRINNKRKRHSI